MTDSYHSSGDPAIQQAGLNGIGNKTAERLEDVGITTVRQLAHAEVEQLASALAANDPRWKAETWRQRAAAWIATAQAHESNESGQTTQTTLSYVFLLTLWTDADGRPIRSRFEYRSPEEPKAEKASREIVGWSPVAFARFVGGAAGLTDVSQLTEEPREPTELVEWSQHYVEGQLVRGGEAAIAIRAELSGEGLPAEEGRVRWRATGLLLPFGGGTKIALGECRGTAQSGDRIDLVFPPRSVPDGLYRARFDVNMSPPAPPDHPLILADRMPAASR
jgi:hypothetical protein